MPNHVTNILTIKCDGGKLEKIKDAILNSDGNMDFNKIIPLPKEFEGFNPHQGIISRAKAELDLPFYSNPIIAGLERDNRERALKSDMNEEDLSQVEYAKKLYKTYGCLYWYDWCLENWDTKWNAYDCSPFDGNEVRFDTAWSMPESIYRALSAKFPDVEFKVAFADEDIGGNCGVVYFKNGEIEYVDVAPNHSYQSEDEKRKWRKFAIGVKGDDNPENWGFDENYDYVDEE